MSWQAKRKGQVLIAAGCLTQRYGSEVARQVPESMASWELGAGWISWTSSSAFEKVHPEPVYHLPETPTVGADEHGALRVAVQGASAYIKIADGCREPAHSAIPPNQRYGVSAGRWTPSSMRPGSSRRQACERSS